MGYVVIFSLPVFVFFILLSFGCFFMGRERGRREGRMEAQMLATNDLPNGVGPPGMQAVDVPPLGGPHPVLMNPYFPPPPPPPPSHYPHLSNIKQENAMNAGFMESDKQ